MASQTADRVISHFMQRRSGVAAEGAGRFACTLPGLEEITYRIASDGRTLFSYGTHFPLAAWRADGSLAVTDSRFQTGNYQSGKPKYGATTDRQISAVKSAAAVAGFVPTDDTFYAYEDAAKALPGLDDCRALQQFRVYRRQPA